MRKIYLASAIFFWTLFAWADMPIEVIDLKYKAPQEVIPMLQPFIAPGGAISGMRNQLVIKTTPENFQELRRIVSELDVIPQQLVISVRQGRQADFETDQKRYGVYIGQNNDRSHIFVGQKQYIAQKKDNHIQQVKVLEGQQAFIQTGTAIPVTADSERDDGSTQTHYQNATTGFYVVPRLTGNGNTVSLQISPFNNQLSRHDGTIQVSEADTTVSAKVGEWVELAGINTSNEQSGSRGSRWSDEREGIWVKVEVK